MLNFLQSLLKFFFRNRRTLKLGLYGPPNSGKTTLANKISLDWLGVELGKVSPIPHETREIQVKEGIKIKNKAGKELVLNICDTPGIATRIDFEDFISAGLSEAQAKKRAKEATRGVIESIKWLDNVDAVTVVLDATQSPYNQVNITLLGNLEARRIPVLIAANKIDLKRAKPQRIEGAFPQYPIVKISAKYGKGINEFYESLFKILK